MNPDVVDKAGLKVSAALAAFIDDRALAYPAARALVFESVQKPNDYTEALLHRDREAQKQTVGGKH